MQDITIALLLHLHRASACNAMLQQQAWYINITVAGLIIPKPQDLLHGVAGTTDRCQTGVEVYNNHCYQPSSGSCLCQI